MLRRIYMEIVELSKDYLYFSIPLIIFKSLYPVLTVLFPKIIIGSIVSKYNFKLILMAIISIMLIKFTFEILIQICENKLKYIGIKLNQKFELKLLKQLMIVDYEVLEDPNILDMKDEALEGISMNNGTSISIYIEKLIDIISSVISILSVAFIIFRISFIFLFVLVIILILDFIIEKLIANYEIKNWSKWIPVNRKFRMVYDLMYNFKYGADIRVFEAEDFFVDKVKCANENMYKLMAEESIVVSKYNIINNFLESAKIFSISYLAVDGLTKRSISIAELGSYLVAVNVFINSVKLISHAIVDINKMTGYMKSYFVFLDLNISERKEIRDIKPSDKNKIKLEFKNVYFKYPSNEKYTLEDISFKIRENEKISLVGLNGSGKSTIIKLLTGLYTPTKGEILFEGHNINHYKKEDLFNKFGVVFQDFNIFPFSIAENISMNHNRNDNIIEELLDRTHLLNKIKCLENGLDENLYKTYNSTSAELSRGEKQKIALIRAIYSDREFLVLDEPTASIDVYTELNFYESLTLVSQNKTAIFISHRLISSKFCDKILFLDKGKIVENGSFKELMRKDSRFKKLFELQKEKFI